MQVLQANLELPAGVVGALPLDVRTAAAALGRCTQRQPLLAGECLFQRGDPAEEFIIIESGTGGLGCLGSKRQQGGLGCRDYLGGEEGRRGCVSGVMPGCADVLLRSAAPPAPNSRPDCVVCTDGAHRLLRNSP